ncbi:MAG: 50S ribosomal protein L25 [Candidatus Aureabacteria bacterium]|nr:50S ribosomal protein L25 [Candidatus Auribacterota bacterium]
MGKKLTMNALLRDSEKEKAYKLRKDGKIPAIVYQRGSSSLSIALDSKEFFKTFHGHVAENVLIDLKFADAPDKEKTVIIKDFQKNPVKEEFLHIDFIEIHAGEKLSTHIPIHLKGKPVGVAKGGILEHTLRELYIECLPKDIPSDIVIDITNLDSGHSIHVRDLDISAEIKVLTPTDTTVVAVAVLKKAEETEEAEGEIVAEAPKEPEVIKKEKEEQNK